MGVQFPPDSWPYGASFSPDPGAQPGWDASRQQVAPQQQPSGTFPFQGQLTQAPGVPPAAQTVPYPYPAYTIPVPQTGQPVAPAVPQVLPLPFVEQSYIENILRLNLGKTATVYCTFEGNSQWNAKSFTGTVEAAGRDHVIIEDEETRVRYLIPMVFVNYFEFTGPLSYEYPYGPQSPTGR
ncbi:spore coat protein GerQ [Sporolactobacillus sp. STSJ-5]|uniref:spore coat protein GerQ n=1 Tax=Sporolactobacillus sp. STSJ-5 TaxID=2965076 RepID=UPI0021038B5A|nr:spore coat protein GerQ [Sporolactobacillus sp. STSJ-5]MCQ2009832.1 spore coat protein GerQ [Sporolactobacillus sp. STSJ-5]